MALTSSELTSAWSAPRTRAALRWTLGLGSCKRPLIVGKALVLVGNFFSSCRRASLTLPASGEESSWINWSSVRSLARAEGAQASRAKAKAPAKLHFNVLVIVGFIAIAAMVVF